MNILAVSGDETTLDRLVAPLCQSGQLVEVARSLPEADDALRGGHFDALVLDLAPPEESLAWLRGLRERRSPVGVITITSLPEVETRIAALECGADDHLIRPVDAREVLARCQALFRRQGDPPRSEVVSCGELTVDSRKREVRHGSAPIDLTPREWSILEFLFQHAGTAVTKERLLRAIAGWDERLAPNAIEVYVSRLRAKLAGTGARISTVRGVGYRLERPEDLARRTER